jgi:hypothetical protein
MVRGVPNVTPTINMQLLWILQHHLQSKIEGNFSFPTAKRHFTTWRLTSILWRCGYFVILSFRRFEMSCFSVSVNNFTMRTLDSISKPFLSDFVHRLNYKIIKLQRFGSWILLPSSGKKGEKRTERLTVEPPGWASLRPQTILHIITHHRQKPSDFDIEISFVTRSLVEPGRFKAPPRHFF